jgi:hypothetical protein
MLTPTPRAVRLPRARQGRKLVFVRLVDRAKRTQPRKNGGNPRPGRTLRRRVAPSPPVSVAAWSFTRLRHGPTTSSLTSSIQMSPRRSAPARRPPLTQLAPPVGRRWRLSRRQQPSVKPVARRGARSRCVGAMSSCAGASSQCAGARSRCAGARSLRAGAQPLCAGARLLCAGARSLCAGASWQWAGPITG